MKNLSEFLICIKIVPSLALVLEIIRSTVHLTGEDKRLV